MRRRAAILALALSAVLAAPGGARAELPDIIKVGVLNDGSGPFADGSGRGSFVAAGSVVTHDVAPDAMAFGRATQVDKPGRAAAFRAGRQKR